MFNTRVAKSACQYSAATWLNEIKEETPLVADKRISQEVFFTKFFSEIPMNSREVDYFQRKSNQLIDYEKFQEALTSVLFFFRPPKEGVFYDDDSEKIYHRPDHSQLLILAGSHFSKGEYKSLGINRDKLLKIPNTNEKVKCDILYFIKNDDQINYEKGSWSVFNYFIKKRIDKQNEILEVLKEEIPLLATQWRYGEHRFCAQKELKEYNFPTKETLRMHAIIFFYKEVKR